MAQEKILVIDDSQTIRMILKALLENSDFQVIIASDGEEGLKKAFEERPDMVIVDLNMPKMNGYEVVERMRKEVLTLNIPIMMLTSAGDEYHEIKGLSLGVDSYVTKPFNEHVIIARIKALLERSKFSISLNPLTLLPGNISIAKEITNRIAAGLKFAVFYVDLNDFKSFNDYYGFDKGDKVIKHTADIVLQTVKKHGNTNDFTGHLGGDDFLVVSTPEKIDDICGTIIKQFDKTISSFYEDKDRKKGYIVVPNRKNTVEKFQIMSISIGVITNLNKEINHIGEVSVLGAQMKVAAKGVGKSAYVVDRRKQWRPSLRLEESS